MTTMQMAQLTELWQAASTIAFSTKVGSQVYALKRLKPEEHGNRRLRRLFPLLASSASQYHHKHLARIFQVDAESVQILMQQFPATLKTCEMRGTDDVLDVLVQALKGLRYLHEQNVLHLNLKPSNVMFEESGNLRLADPLCYSPGSTVSFGINPDYGFFSPAQLDPTVQVSASCDLYGLAMTLAMKLNEGAFENHVSACHEESIAESQQGSVPAPHFVKAKSKSGFKSRSVSRWSKWHSDYQYPNPSFGTLDASLSENLVEILDRMLLKDHEARFQSADEVLTAIAQIPDAGSMTLGSSSQKVISETSRNWARGIETVLLGGHQAGESRFSDSEFGVESKTNNKSQPIRFEPDGASWFVDAGTDGRLVVNGDLKAGRIAVNHGDILRLGAEGPDILVHRNETDPGRIIEAAREAMDRDFERVSLSDETSPAAMHAGSSRPTSSLTTSKSSNLLPLFLIMLAAAAVVCIVLFVMALGGSQ